MKTFKILMVFLGLFTFTSCKFDITPVGVYQGTFTASNFPVTSGDGTLTITEPSKGLYTINFVSAGNPDINMTDIPIQRYPGLYTRFYYSNKYNSPVPYPYITVDYFIYTNYKMKYQYVDTVSLYILKYITFEETK